LEITAVFLHVEAVLGRFDGMRAGVLEPCCGLYRAGSRSLTLGLVRRKRYSGKARVYGVEEAARYLGTSRRTVTRLLMRGEIVPPLARLACGPIWSESQLDEMLLYWRPARWDELQVRQLTLARRLGRLERRFDALVRALARGETRAPVAVWEGPLAVRRHRQGRSGLATRAEARRALAEAKLLRLVADLGDEDVVLRGVAQELGETADLRQKLKAVKDARRKRALMAEAVESHGGT
jgi:ParB-like chromosome segregation protein Spo0J